MSALTRSSSSSSSILKGKERKSRVYGWLEDADIWAQNGTTTGLLDVSFTGDDDEDDDEDDDDEDGLTTSCRRLGGGNDDEDDTMKRI
ncbi:hypothetical protein M0802_008071 [Mischocyttarus mexicanus]|nr:hypothetical protein M0802_008071 [Mischocyttarus mexicanus]